MQELSVKSDKAPLEAQVSASVMDPVRAFSPGGITSFFEPYRLRQSQLPREARSAARGGGFTTERGTTTRITAKRSRSNRIQIFLNKRPANDCHTTEAVARLLLEQTDRRFAVKIEHDVAIPIGAGYGASAAGALSAALAMNELLGLGLTFDQVGFFAHLAEIRCKTGLGTVGPLMVGGCILQKEGGPPGICRIDRIPVRPSYRIISGCYGPIPTSEVLKSKSVSRRIGKEGRKTMESILSKPSLDNFLHSSEEFARKIGFMTERIERLIKAARRMGAVGATQNMLGEAFHAIVEEDQTEELLERLRVLMPMSRLFSTAIDFEGARLL